MLTPEDLDGENLKMANEVEDDSDDIIVSVKETKFEDLARRVDELEKEKVESLENFNAQRGRLQKLYLTKEEESYKLKLEVDRLTKELNEAKSEICVAGFVKENEMEEEKRKAQSEIDTLHQLVRELSSTSQEEIKKLKETIKHLESELKENKIEKDGATLLSSGTSNVLSVTKTLARKVVSQLGSDSEVKSSQDNLEDNMKKAQEDAEVLRSLVVPLEEEIQALKDKIRYAYDRLKKYEPSSEDDLTSLHHQNNNKTPSPAKTVACGMCVNYEAQLVAQQQAAGELEREKEGLESNLERFREDLVKETEFRKQMEHKWNESKEEYKLRVTELRQQYVDVSNELKDLQTSFTSILQDTQQQLSLLTVDREKTYREMRELQEENEKIVGKHLAHSSELRNEAINLPDNVEELQLLMLKLREELISAKVAKEMKEDNEKVLKCEIDLLSEQLKGWAAKENAMAAEFSLIKRQSEAKEKERMKYYRLCENLKKTEGELRENLKMKELELSKIVDEMKRLEEKECDLQRQVSSLQQELDTSETVQQDFVRLSQSLQIQLEKIREAETDVRWQHPDDVHECPSCRLTFGSDRKKINCYHCGHVFCTICLCNEVKSGPNQRIVRVCQVCNTLLNREKAPYFSQDPPHSPNSNL